MNNEQREQATMFSLDDVPLTQRADGTATQRQHYKRLKRANSLDWNGNWADENSLNEADWDATIEALASSLELTDHQTNRAKVFFDELPSNYQRGYSLRLLALCVCAFAGREDGRDYHPNQFHPNGVNTSPFGQLADDLDIGYSELYSCWSKMEADLS